MFERFTDRSRKVVEGSWREAAELGHAGIGPEHLLLGLLRESGGLAGQVLASVGLTLPAAREQVAASLGRGDARPGVTMPFTPETVFVFQLAIGVAGADPQAPVGTEHLLLALLLLAADETTPAGRLVARLLGNPETIRARVGAAMQAWGRPGTDGSLRTSRRCGGGLASLAHWCRPPETPTRPDVGRMAEDE